MDSKTSRFITAAVVGVFVIGVVVIAWMIYSHGSNSNKSITKSITKGTIKGTTKGITKRIDPVTHKLLDVIKFGITSQNKTSTTPGAANKLKLTCDTAWKTKMPLPPKPASKDFYSTLRSLPTGYGGLTCTFNAHPTDASWTLSYSTTPVYAEYTEKVQLSNALLNNTLSNTCEIIDLYPPYNTKGCVRGTSPTGTTIVYNETGGLVSLGSNARCTSCALIT
jgi:hypothetical protein